jgi:hypothetical protein
MCPSKKDNLQEEIPNFLRERVRFSTEDLINIIAALIIIGIALSI